MPAHQGDDSRLIQAKLRLNRLKCRAIFPSHFHNARDAGIAQCRGATDVVVLQVTHSIDLNGMSLVL